LGTTALIVAGVWLVGLALAIVRDWQVFVHWRLALVLLCVLVLIWVARVLGWLSMRNYLLAMSVVGLVQVLNSVHVDIQAWVPTTVLTMVAISIGLLTRPPAAVRGVTALTLAAVVSYAAAFALQGVPVGQWGSAVVRVVYLLAAGMIAAATARLGLAVVRREDRAAAARIRESVRRAEVRQDAEDRVRVARTLHDTVVNTLGLLRSGVAEGQADTVRARCQDDLLRIDGGRIAGSTKGTTADFPGSGLANDLAEIVETRTQSRVELSLDSEGLNRLGDMPRDAVEAVCATVTEALNNASKHASGASVAVDVTVANDGVRPQLRVEIIDSGPGIQDSAIRRRLAAKFRDIYAAPGGLTSSFRSGAGGTTVTVEWQPPEASAVGHSTQERDAFASAVRPAVVRMVGWLTLMCLVRLFAAVWQGATPAEVVVIGLLDLIVIGGLCAMAAWAAQRRWPVQTWVVVVLLLATPLLAAYPGLGAVDCGGPSLGRWGPDAALLVLLLVVLLANSLWWAVAGTVLFALSTAIVVSTVGQQPESCIDTAAPGLIMNSAVLLAMAFLRLTIERSATAATTDYGYAKEQQIDSARELVRARVRATYLNDAVGRCRPLLASLANGTANPRDPEVVLEAGADEAYLRSMIGLTDSLESSPLAATLAVVAASARARGVACSISYSRVPEPPAAVAAWLATGLEEILAFEVAGEFEILVVDDGIGGQVVCSGPAAPTGPGLERPGGRGGIPPADPPGAWMEAGTFAGWVSVTFGWRPVAVAG
jgi:signal transduction histidine kinase